MFDKAIIDTDRFMDLPMPSKALYFLLGMEADDEGFVSYKKVMRIHGGNEDDVRILSAKKFIIPFPSGVVVITDWNKNNWLDSRRIKPTEYQKEKQMLTISKDNRYLLSNGLASIEEYSIEESRGEETSDTSVAEKDPINPLIDLFKDLNPSYEKLFRNKTQRKSLEALVKKYGVEKVAGFIKAAVACKDEQFAPTITTPYQLEDKLGQLASFYTKKKNNKSNVVEI